MNESKTSSGNIACSGAGGIGCRNPDPIMSRFCGVIGQWQQVFKILELCGMLKFLVPIIICTYFLPKFSEIFKDNFYVNSHAESKISKLA